MNNVFFYHARVCCRARAHPTANGQAFERRASCGCRILQPSDPRNHTAAVRLHTQYSASLNTPPNAPSGVPASAVIYFLECCWRRVAPFGGTNALATWAEMGLFVEKIVI